MTIICFLKSLKKRVECIFNFSDTGSRVFFVLFLKKESSTVGRGGEESSTETPTSLKLGFQNTKICSLPQGLVQHRLCKEEGKKPQLSHHTGLLSQHKPIERRENEKQLSVTKQPYTGSHDSVHIHILSIQQNFKN